MQINDIFLALLDNFFFFLSKKNWSKINVRTKKKKEFS